MPFTWTRIPKELQQEELRGTYKDWKPQLAAEGGHRCVYCAIPDSRMGGIYCFHVEHFEPKSKAPQRVNDWTNLFYVCPICNVFKGDDWPAHDSPVAYVNPAEVDYETIFSRLPTGAIEGATPAASYMISRVFLNRPQLILERREAELRARLTEMRDVLTALSPLASKRGRAASEKLLECFERLNAVSKLADELLYQTPYETDDVRRRGK